MPSRGIVLFRALRVLVLLVATLGLLVNSLTFERLSVEAFLWIYVPFVPLAVILGNYVIRSCLLYTSPSPRDRTRSRMPSSA